MTGSIYYATSGIWPEDIMDQKTLKSIFHYDPEIGDFVRKYRAEMDRHDKYFNTRYGGKVAGYIHPDGYKMIRLNGRDYPAHRLAWLYMTGAFPTKIIDHIDGVKLNNRFANLREVTYSQSAMNTKTHCDNSSGARGVTVCDSRYTRAYKAGIQVDGKRVYLGRFSTFEEAKAAYDAAAKELHGEYRRAA